MHYKILYCIGIVICICGICVACQKVTPPTIEQDAIAQLLSAMRQQKWEGLEKQFLYPEHIKKFPLKKALAHKEKWLQLRRIRSMDQHLIFDIDTTSVKDKKSCQRYTFWAKINKMYTDETTQVEESFAISQIKIVDWSPAKPCYDQAIELDEIEAPTRFSATSFRGVSKVASLGVLSHVNQTQVTDQWDIEQTQFTMSKNRLKPSRRGDCAS